jgi:CheY-like chemotaxis protein
MAALLEGSGDEVRTATSGADALAVLDQFTPEVALLDIGLPDVSGYELARKVRARLGERVTLIAITGWGQDADRARAAEAGFDHHLTKPVDHEELHRLLV